LANKERLSQEAKKRYLKNCEKIKARVKIYKKSHPYFENKEKRIEQRKRYYQKHKKEVDESNKLWVLKNKNKVKKIKDRYREKHRKELQEKGRLYAKKNIFRYKKNKKIWRINNPDKVKSEKLKWRFGISLEQYKSLLLDQKNQCGICNRKFDSSNHTDSKYPCVDHNHTNGIIRGILCRSCNSGIGGLKDDPIFLQNALLWIQNKFISSESSSKKINVRPQFRYVLKRKYNLTIEQYLKLASKQGNKCGICKKNLSEVQINVDHDHRTQNIRGLLCSRCNRAIGLLHEDSGIINNAIIWVKERKKDACSRVYQKL
jgi:hypothetical protein